MFADFLKGDDMKQNAINIAPSPNLKVSSELLSDKWDAAGEEEAEKRELSNLLLEADNQNKRRSLSKQVISSPVNSLLIFPQSAQRGFGDVPQVQPRPPLEEVKTPSTRRPKYLYIASSNCTNQLTH